MTRPRNSTVVVPGFPSETAPRAAASASAGTAARPTPTPTPTPATAAGMVIAFRRETPRCRAGSAPGLFAPSASRSDIPAPLPAWWPPLAVTVCEPANLDAQLWPPAQDKPVVGHDPRPELD